jgi:hypothetical protein
VESEDGLASEKRKVHATVETRRDHEKIRKKQSSLKEEPGGGKTRSHDEVGTQEVETR